MSGDEETALEAEETNEDTKRSKPTEGSAVIQQQADAVEEQRQLTSRKYSRVSAGIPTVFGGAVRVSAWASSEAPHNEKKDSPPLDTKCICEICHREFLDKRRLAIHRNVHLKAGLLSAQPKADEEVERSSQNE